MKINERINDLLIERGWSVNQLANEAFLTQSTVSNIFNRKSVPTVATLTAICKAFEISLSEFFNESENDSNIYLTEDETTLLENFRSLNKNNKQALIELSKKLK